MSNKYSKTAIDKAGYLLIKSDSPYEENDALKKVNYWRSIHRFPLKWLLDLIPSQISLKDDILVAGRIKKLDTIIDKLKRSDTPNDLKTMFDIAGCRIVVKNLDMLHEVSTQLMKVPEYDQNKSPKRDYILKPKKSGYRGKHLIFQRQIEGYNYGNGLWMELQIRTRLQHAWATAVEIYDIAVSGSRLKFGEKIDGAGDFFENISQLIQLEEEGNNSSNEKEEICARLNKEKSTNLVMSVLREACNASSSAELKNSLSLDNYCLIDFDADIQFLNLTILPENAAVEEYFKKEEKSEKNHNLVLVRASSLEQMKETYPNYFGDITTFINFVEEYLN